jgi:hypothetical protein
MKQNDSMKMIDYQTTLSRIGLSGHNKNVFLLNLFIWSYFNYLHSITSRFKTRVKKLKIAGTTLHYYLNQFQK